MDAVLDDDLIQDFFGEYDDACHMIREILIELDDQPDDEEAPHALFRSMHSVKSNLRMMGLNELSEFIHHMENILDQIREGKRQYISLFSDLFLLSLESVRSLCHDQLHKQPGALENLPALITGIVAVCDTDNNEDLIVSAIRMFDPGFEHDDNKNSDDGSNDESPSLKQQGLDDLGLFKHMALAMEQRVIGKQGCTDRILDMAVALNTLAEQVVDPEQLTAAVYMHDVGMSFIPLDIANKDSAYTDSEREKLTSHPLIAMRLLRRLNNWDEAAKIVAQHHERIDGSGYPEKLQGDAICTGAKLLNIVDTFESMSQTRADRDHRRTVIRIVAEINGHKGTQFDDFWVEMFNQYIRQRFSK